MIIGLMKRTRHLLYVYQHLFSYLEEIGHLLIGGYFGKEKCEVLLDIQGTIFGGNQTVGIV